MNIVGKTPICTKCGGAGGWWVLNNSQWHTCNTCKGTGYENDPPSLQEKTGTLMNRNEVYTALESHLPPPTAALWDETLTNVVASNDVISRVLTALRSFLGEVLVLPPKEVVMQGFEDLLDAVLSVSELPVFAKRLVKGAAMIAAEKLYDALASKV